MIIFKALSDEKRLRMMLLLAKYDSGLCVCEMTDALQLPQYAISRQLSILRKAGLVTTKKNGLWVYYYPADTHPIFTDLLRCLSESGGFSSIGEDMSRLEKRLLLREDGMCVIGFSQDQQNGEGCNAC
ncbi:metalloregulator ArsR/SmtB family transcription factor [Marispirochaeta sp.]|uniref:ArsR/SmtB family transcription factor n=1 Tax=Marispirochaeta sp. TaxID=2038653 RepID=UPI0029C81841|nr:metalloregulator ArsR/SmtB family transcription factor [Marispirochaeta sp.]